MREFIERLQQKPKATKKMYVIVSATIVTFAIASVWAMARFHMVDIAFMERGDSPETQEARDSVSPFNMIKDTVNTFKDEASSLLGQVNEIRESFSGENSSFSRPEAESDLETKPEPSTPSENSQSEDHGFIFGLPDDNQDQASQQEPTEDEQSQEPEQEPASIDDSMETNPEQNPNQKQPSTLFIPD